VIALTLLFLAAAHIWLVVWGSSAYRVDRRPQIETLAPPNVFSSTKLLDKSDQNHSFEAVLSSARPDERVLRSRQTHRRRTSLSRSTSPHRGRNHAPRSSPPASPTADLLPSSHDISWLAQLPPPSPSSRSASSNSRGHASPTLFGPPSPRRHQMHPPEAVIIDGRLYLHTADPRAEQLDWRSLVHVLRRPLRRPESSMSSLPGLAQVGLGSHPRSHRLAAVRSRSPTRVRVQESRSSSPQRPRSRSRSQDMETSYRTGARTSRAGSPPRPPRHVSPDIIPRFPQLVRRRRSRSRSIESDSASIVVPSPPAPWSAAGRFSPSIIIQPPTLSAPPPMRPQYVRSRTSLSSAPSSPRNLRTGPETWYAPSGFSPYDVPDPGSLYGQPLHNAPFIPPLPSESSSSFERQNCDDCMEEETTRTRNLQPGDTFTGIRRLNR
jgi:hypothetical protein